MSTSATGGPSTAALVDPGNTRPVPISRFAYQIEMAGPLG
jgi:hypothetical protein